jgi:protein TonB
MALILIAFGALVWRPQHRPEAAAVLQSISARALALVSGNPLLVERPALSIAVPAPEIQPVQRSALRMAPPTAAVAVAAPRDAVESAAPLPLSTSAVQAPLPVRDAAPPIAVPDAPAAHVAEKSPPLQVVPPVYPPRAMIAGVEGAVELEYQIGAGGKVEQIRVLRAHPVGVFETAAKTALSAWRFAPADSGERRTQNFAFTLHGQGRAEEQCQAPTGSLICRRSGD